MISPVESDGDIDKENISYIEPDKNFYTVKLEKNLLYPSYKKDSKIAKRHEHFTSQRFNRKHLSGLAKSYKIDVNSSDISGEGNILMQSTLLRSK